MVQSLCNACGIRQRKARRAMMAPGAAPLTTGSGIVGGKGTGDAHPKAKKEKRAADVDRSLPFKKRCKVVIQDHTATNGAAPVEANAAEPAAVSVSTAAAAPVKEGLVNTIGVNWSNSPTAPGTACSFLPSSVPALDEITDAAMLLMTLSCELVRS